MTKYINCPFISIDKPSEIAEFLSNEHPQQEIDNLLWSNRGYFPQVGFSIAYTEHSIVLRYFVKERYAVALHTQINDLVYKDSCVEFFVSFEGVNYYNLEFNCLGTPYGAYGPGNPGRVLLPADVIKQIKVDVKTDIVSNDGFTRWMITLDIPLSTFIYDDITSLKGRECKANFYKCGDETPEPHYLSWNSILSNQPNFHLPQYFGTVKFL